VNERRIHIELMLAAGLMMLMVFLLMPAAGEAACSGSSPTRTAASASRTDVNDCVSAAASGDTIRVPAGSASWSSPIGLPGSKDLTIIGSTVVSCSGRPITCSANNQTNITCSTCFTIDLGASHRISGFTMLNANDGAIGTTGNQNLSKHFRIDHNRIVSSGGWAPMEIKGGSSAVHPQGIVDNNLLVDISIHANGTAFQLDEGDQQNTLWAQRTPLGDSTAIIYIEDNHYQNTSGNINNADSNYAGRYVYRFNNTTSGRQTVEVHSVQGDNRASQRWEIYGNSGANSSGFSGTAFIRGGSGVAFGNRLTANWPSFGLLMDNVRSEESVSGSGRCNGSSSWDQNASSGYRCRDQIGTSHDLSKWSPGGSYNQAFQPVYFWDNLEGNAPMDVDNSGLSTWIRENRDYYRDNVGFNGTSGVGVGPLSNRPSSCATGVAYWATDEGEWNSRQSGPDGRLYKCVSTNSWALYYTPYPYPHPWAQGQSAPPPSGGGGGGSSAAPAAPTNLQVR
jgi:hypothetical protein